GPEPAGGAGGTGAAEGPTDLEHLVQAMSEAAGRLGLTAPRRPWPEPLPDSVDLGDLEPAPAPAPAVPGRPPSAVLGLADDPGGQRRLPIGWDGAAGNLLLYGVAGSGTTTTLATLAWSLARRYRPDEVHLYFLDFGPGDLVALEELPHVGAVVTAHQSDRQVRLLRQLRAELDRRRQARAAGGEPSAEPAVVLLVDNWAAFAAAFDDGGPVSPREEIGRLVADGPALGLFVAITADHATAVPLAVANLVTSKLVFRLGDRHEYAGFGLTRGPAPRPGRALDVASGLEVQIARAGAAARAGARRGPRTAPPVGVLPAEVAVDALTRPGAVAPRLPDGGSVAVTVGLADATLGPAALVFRAADHASVTGPARSGKSTALCTLAAMAPADVDVIAVVPRPGSPLGAGAVGVDHVVTATAGLAGLVDPGRRQLILVDDADSVDDAGGVLAGLLGAHHPGIHVVAAARPDALRSAYGHWTRDLRRSRLGLALRPEAEDGDLFGTTLPRRHPPAPLPGRGYLVVDGAPEVIQVARP
ncbi:MAG TPA: FtsK/SpoIIIE domain-containing protein, partial [Acidimicrobiales bacterium]|nr:FtsK/SpoIIIE domain-containing protein [Acidimicrobiales bacterium]